MEDHDKDEKPQSATTEQSTDKSLPEEPIKSDTQPTQHEEMEDGPIHSQKIATSGMEDMSLEDERSQHGMQPPIGVQTDLGDSKPVQSPTNILDTAPSLQPGNTGLGLTESPISPNKSDNGEQIVQSPPAVEETDRPSVPNRTISEGISRKMTGTFSWLSRATNIRKNTASPPRQNQPSFPGFAARRSTTSSVSTIASHQDKALPPVKDGQDREKGPSLQERFQAARMESEASTRRSSSDTTPPANGEPLKSPTSEYSPDGGPASPQPQDQQNRSRATTNVDMKLPPGTAAGISMGPSTEDESHVNWDLWQTLVYEGPSAVAKTSGAQLNAAIQNGIPAPIRGVVWQVLADSKSEHLETVYRTLLGKEDTNGVKSPALSREDSTTPMNGEKQESLASSASSVHSHTSTPATSTHATSPPPTTTAGHDEEEKSQDTPVPASRKKSADQTASVQKLEKMIRKDLGSRTAYSKYLASSGLQEGLFGVCKAYALYDSEIGYAQGMNFIAMPLLFNMPEDEAFTLFVRMMSKYDLRSLFTPEMTGLHLRLYQFERLLEDHEPALYCHLHRRGVSPTLYATQWFLTLFAYRFPLQLVQRIYDLILSEGLSAILKFGIVLMKKNAQTLLAMKDMSALTTHLKERLFDVYIDKSPSASSILDSGFFGGLTGGADKEIYHADALVRDACAIDISEKTLAQYASEFEVKTKENKAREDELESLRTTNTALSSKLRSLEARVQQQDNDHVGIASELIKTKVENQSLADQNESLKMQVDELRKVVEAQPGEVEERLKEEMQRIMTRNMEVQNQNRGLEDQMAEMEQELVGTKMKFAELNADYEHVKQKLATIQQMLGGAASAAAISPTGSGR
ncbi:rab-GTPase-TBC domain-containing protein [Elsinoe ampelina]|uniref:GTPase-activating protein GYP5 n=1 Tax=Elsinoe ampelina TaxID=302913 RepID=A0A6A6G1U0_9PEZI|nr:rab-GTPase-TBC domain-containing protein [Elsinoe ampelina]